MANRIHLGMTCYRESNQPLACFESLKHESEGAEFWYARELRTVLDYSTWDKFERVIKKAITACEGSGQSSEDHFSQVGKMVDIGSGAKRTTRDYQLSRYACYLVLYSDAVTV